MNDQVTNQEIVDHVEGTATRGTSRRVLRNALRKRSVRESLVALDAHAPQYTASDMPLTGDDVERGRRLRASLRNITLSVAAEAPSSPDTSDSAARDAVASRLTRLLQTGRQLLTLPCLAPITASPASDADIQRQTVQTGDGVRIEFQQLPGLPPYRLRVLVDASQIELPSGTTDRYTIAYLTLEDSGSGPSEVPDRHVLVIPLNHEGRGYTDFTIGDGAKSNTVAAPVGNCRLVSATLSRESADQQQSI